jgi:hypothetical protein
MENKNPSIIYFAKHEINKKLLKNSSYYSFGRGRGIEVFDMQPFGMFLVSRIFLFVFFF